MPCFLLLLNELYDALRHRRLLHHWFRDVNLFDEFAVKATNSFAKKLERIGENPAPFILDDGCCCLSPCCTRLHKYKFPDRYDEIALVKEQIDEQDGFYGNSIPNDGQNDDQDGLHDNPNQVTGQVNERGEFFDNSIRVNEHIEEQCGPIDNPSDQVSSPELVEKSETNQIEAEPVIPAKDQTDAGMDHGIFSDSSSQPTQHVSFPSQLDTGNQSSPYSPVAQREPSQGCVQSVAVTIHSSMRSS